MPLFNMTLTQLINNGYKSEPWCWKVGVLQAFTLFVNLTNPDLRAHRAGAQVGISTREGATFFFENKNKFYKSDGHFYFCMACAYDLRKFPPYSHYRTTVPIKRLILNVCPWFSLNNFIYLF